METASLSRNLYKAVDVLQTISPRRLDVLGSQYPLFKELLEPGLGPIEGGSGDRSQEQLVLETWSEALDAEIERCEGLLGDAQRDLNRARWIEVASTIASSLAASTLIAMIGGGTGTKTAQVTVAVVGLICSGASAVIALMRRTLGNVDKSKQYVELWKNIGEAKVVRIHLRTLSRTDTPPDEQILKRVESLLLLLHAAAP